MNKEAPLPCRRIPPWCGYWCTYSTSYPLARPESCIYPRPRRPANVSWRQVLAAAAAAPTTASASRLAETHQGCWPRRTRTSRRFGVGTRLPCRSHSQAPCPRRTRGRRWWAARQHGFRLCFRKFESRWPHVPLASNWRPADAQHQQ